MSELKFRLAGVLGRGLIHAALGTVRFELEQAPGYRALMAEGQPVIYALWHGRLLPLTYYHRHRGFAAMISRSADGEYIARVVEGWGFLAVRGSSSRGGRDALRGMIEAARSGRSLAITPDGPRGPRQRLQPGVISAAQVTGHPIVPVTAGATRAWWPGSWDRFCVPKPFSRVRIIYDEPVWIARRATEAERRDHAEALEARLNALTDEVDGDGGPDR